MKDIFPLETNNNNIIITIVKKKKSNKIWVDYK